MKILLFFLAFVVTNVFAQVTPPSVLPTSAFINIWRQCVINSVGLWRYGQVVGWTNRKFRYGFTQTKHAYVGYVYQRRANLKSFQ